jgi:hypothetical protein
MEQEPHRFVPRLNLRKLYDLFDASITGVDCGMQCAPHNPNGIPFCCDICHAVPTAYRQEWEYLQKSTDLWHIWRGDECTSDPADPSALLSNTPDHMLLLACRGPAHCQRPYRSITCRQFPFFPYMTSQDRFIGLAYHWSFEPSCWVISNLAQVTDRYREEFVRFYDSLLANWPDEHEGYAALSEEMREQFAARRRRIPILHRRGGYYLLSPASERLERISPQRLPRFGPYRQEEG